MPPTYNVDAQIIDWTSDLSIGNKWAPQQDDKSNKVTQDEEQHNTTLRRRNHEDFF